MSRARRGAYLLRRRQEAPLLPGEEGDVIARLVEEELYGKM